VTDPTAAERARRYRARRRERDASVTLREPELVAVVGQLVAELRVLSALIRADYPQSAPAVENRDGESVTPADRDVTERHAPEGAPAPARVGARLTGPSGPSEPLASDRNGVTPAEPRILELLAAVREPPSIGSIADALRIPSSEVADELVALQRIGRVRRIPATLPGDRDRWALLGVTSPSETIRCTAYREHATSGHRRDPASGRFRCYLCEPESEPASDAYRAASPA
jgi:hypothetical protein